MRLINVDTLALEDFIGEPGNGVPPYAILSHTWGKQEVSFRQMTGDHETLKELEGFKKIVKCCAIAKSEGHKLVWIDTCCIDKSSSAELSEAINSMFRWYQKAAICYAYLKDDPSLEDPAGKSSSFRRSRWFTRGWTLQELLAPEDIIFFSKDWREIGTKHSLSKIISEITKIDENILKGDGWSGASISCKMSWASSRQTTRLEDMAYCLMGIFDVNMPLLYGEGKKAFYRLQLEIMKLSDDQTIFAWHSPIVLSGFSGLLAESPRVFKDSGNIVDNISNGKKAISFDVSKQYIRLETHIMQLFEKDSIFQLKKNQLNPRLKFPDDSVEITYFWEHILRRSNTRKSVVLAVLRCTDKLGRIVIPLIKLDSGKLVRYSEGLWLRINLNEQASRRILVRAIITQDMERFPPSIFEGWKHHYYKSDILVQSLPISQSGYYVSQSYPPDLMSALGGTPGVSGAVAGINQVLGPIDVIVFFAHESPSDHPPFALGFDCYDQLSDPQKYLMRCRVGPSIKDWEGGKLAPSENGNTDIVDLDAQVPLSDSLSIFIRSRKKAPQSEISYVRISIGAPLSWQKQ